MYSGALTFSIVLLLGLILLFIFSWQLTMPTGTPPSVDDWKNFASVAGIGLTAISSITSAWLTFRNMLRQAAITEKLNSLNTFNELGIPAYGKLFSAASRYYRNLATLEIGKFDAANVVQGEDAMVEAEGSAIYVMKEYMSCWYNFWQEARLVKESCEADPNDLGECKRLWNKHAKKLAQHLAEMRYFLAETRESFSIKKL